MARIRQIKPEYFLDDELAASCCRDARLLFIGIWPIADREGRLEDRPAKIKAQVFPFDDDITVPKVAELIDQLCSGGWLVRYEIDGRRYLWVRTFTIHQHFHRDEQASKLPEPPQDIKIHRTCTVQAPELHPTCTPTSTSTSGNRVSGNGNAPDGAHPGAKRRRTSQKTGCPATFVVDESLKEWASKAVPGLDVEAETPNFLDYHKSKGNSFSDWDAAWRTWMRRAAKWGGNNGQKILAYKPDTVGADHGETAGFERVAAEIRQKPPETWTETEREIVRAMEASAAGH